MPYKVYFRRRTGSRRILRVGIHHNLRGMSDRDFRIALIQDYNRTNKKVEKIEHVRS